MEIIIHTLEGTFIVPSHKQAELTNWLQSNAIKAGQQNVLEQNSEENTYAGKRLLSENI